MDEVQGKYKIKPFGSKSGKQRKLKHEEIDPGHYRPSARCVAFTTSEDRILFWVKALQDHYYELPSSNQSFHIKWIDHVNKDDTAFEHIELKVSHQSGQSGEHRTLLFTITVYLTTGVIMCQGSSYELWYEKEFPRLKERMDQIFDIYHGKAATNEEEDFHERVAENELTLRHLKEASELSKFNKKTKPSFEENLSEDEADETLKTKSLRNTPPSTPCFLRKRRNSVDSVRGLSTRSKASLTALKSVVADLETDFTEVKNTVSTTNDLYNGKMDVLADKIAQLENTFKVKIEFLSARVIDLETNYDSLLAENVKLKNDIQNIKQLQKGTIKRVNNLEAVTNNTTFVNAARDATPAEQPETSGKNSLPNNPFNVLLTIDQENHPVDAENSVHNPIQEPHLLDHEDTAPKLNPQLNNNHPPVQLNNNHPPEHIESSQNNDIVLLIDSNGKFIQQDKFSRGKNMKKIFTPTISSAIESVTNQNLGSPSSLIIHTGTNDLEKSPPEVCFDNFQALIDLTAQKFPHTKIIISSLLVRNDQFDATRSQLNSQLSRLRSYPNVHFVNNENITSTMLHDRKHLKKHKIGLLVSNLKDCVFNRISRRTNPQLNTKSRMPPISHPPPLLMAPNVKPFTPETNGPSFNHLPPRVTKTYAEVVKPPTGNMDSDTLTQLIKLYEMIRQS